MIYCTFFCCFLFGLLDALEFPLPRLLKLSLFLLRVVLYTCVKRCKKPVITANWLDHMHAGIFCDAWQSNKYHMSSLNCFCLFTLYCPHSRKLVLQQKTHKQYIIHKRYIKHITQSLFISKIYLLYE